MPDWEHGLTRWTCYCPTGEGRCSYKNAQQEYRWTKEDAVSKLAHHLTSAWWHKNYMPMEWEEAVGMAEAVEMTQYVYDKDQGWLTEEAWMAKNGDLPEPKVEPPKCGPKEPTEKRQREPQWHGEGKGEEPRRKVPLIQAPLIQAWAPPSSSRGPELGLLPRDMNDALAPVLQRSSYERLGDPEVDFYRTARVLVDAANTISRAAHASCQVAETAALGWRSEAQRLSIVARELMHLVDTHAPQQPDHAPPPGRRG